MGQLLKSFSRLRRIDYWVSGHEPARIEACWRETPPTLHKLPDCLGKYSLERRLLYVCFVMVRQSDIYVDKRPPPGRSQTAPIKKPIDKTRIIEAFFLTPIPNPDRLASRSFQPVSCLPKGRYRPVVRRVNLVWTGCLWYNSPP